MAHPRKLIRQAVVALLAGANTAAADRVVGTRIEPHRKSKLPALAVYTLTDAVDEEITTRTEEGHRVELEIAAWVAHSDSAPADDAMDDLAEQVEAAMRETVYSGSYLGGKASEIKYEGTVIEMVEDDGRSDPEIGVAVLKYTITYRAAVAAPAPTDAFTTVKTTTTVVGGVADTAPVVDQFTVQEP